MRELGYKHKVKRTRKTSMQLARMLGIRLKEFFPERFGKVSYLNICCLSRLHSFSAAEPEYNDNDSSEVRNLMSMGR